MRDEPAATGSAPSHSIALENHHPRANGSHQVSVRRDAAHIGAARFELSEMAQLSCVSNRTEISDEAPDDLGIGGGCSARCRNDHAAVALAFDRAPCRDR